MNINLTGLLFLPNELVNPAVPMNTIQDVYLTIIDDTECKKVRNILTQYPNHHLPIKVIKDSGAATYVITIKMKNYNGKFGDKMLLLPRQEWINKRFVLNIKTRSYTFTSKYDYNKGEKIHGIAFGLEKIEILD
jgi:hypothetical protein